MRLLFYSETCKQVYFFFSQCHKYLIYCCLVNWNDIFVSFMSPKKPPHPKSVHATLSLPRPTDGALRRSRRFGHRPFLRGLGHHSAASSRPAQAEGGHAYPLPPWHAGALAGMPAHASLPVLRPMRACDGLCNKSGGTLMKGCPPLIL